MLLRDEEEVELSEMEWNDMVNPLISSPASTSWKIQQVWEPDMLYVDYTLLPPSPMEDFALWNHSWSPPPPPHRQESGMIKGVAKAFDAQLQEDAAGGALLTNDWRFELLPDSRQRIANKIILTLKRHLPVSGDEGLLELRKIAIRFEEKVYTAATSQIDYLRKISLKMLTMETKSQHPVCTETVPVVDESLHVQLDAKSPPEDPTLHYLQSGEECALPDPQRSVTEHRNLKRKGDAGPSGQNHTICDLGSKQKMDKKMKKTWGIGGSISLNDLKQHFGKKREEAAESLDVSVSTLKRICRENGISRWPSKNIKRERLLLSNLSTNETVSEAGGGRISISTTPTAFASTEVLAKSNQQNNLSLDNEIGTSVNHGVLRNDEGNGETRMIQEGYSADQEVLYKPQEFEPGPDSFNPAYSSSDAPTILYPLPQERMPAEDSPDQQGEEIARQIEITDGTSHLEKQCLGRERLGCNTEKEVIVRVEDSSSYDFGSVLELIQDHHADFASFHLVDKDPLISTDDLESNCIKSQSTLVSESEPSLINDARRMKLVFEKLITLPLEDLTNTNQEASMTEALTILSGNLSLFTDEQAKQLLEFKFDFPTIMYSWRDCSQTRIDCRNFLAEFERTNSLLETSTKEEVDLKDRYTQIECKEKEMLAQLEAIQKEKNELTKRRSENFIQNKHLAALAEEQAGRTKEKELQMSIASAKLDKLKSQWASVQSSFN
ncbi:hypothetical protein BC332_06538 [Capsicum chinense]|nr:hypothetical protein BC332_06538 [Capsicum chinense]